MSKYRDLFIAETREHIHGMNDLIVSLERESGDREKIDSLFRSAHSIKGMAASMGYGGISELAHRMEDLMARVRSDSIPFDAGVADLLLEGADCLEAMVADVEEEREEELDVSALKERLAAYETAQKCAPGESSPSVPEPRPVEVEGKGRSEKKVESAQTVRVRTEILDQLINTTGELITNKNRLLSVGREIGSTRLNEAVAELTKLLRELYNGVMKVRLMPLSSVSSRFPRMVRDLAKKSGKEVEFVVEGQELELDRGILEELADPLVHILRNSIDHGLEPGDERLASGKPEKGMVRLSASREMDRVVITVEDDGRGMDPARILASAVEKGFLDPSRARELSIRETLLLTCLPGFSTAREVTDISGRGVGMDSVNATIQSLAGSLAIESEPGRGSRIIIRLPLTISIINVLLARAAGYTVGIPVTAVSHTMELRRDMVLHREERKLFSLGEETLPLLDLNRLFDHEYSPPEGEFLPLFIAEIKGGKVGIAVERFLGQQDLFVKPLGRPMARLKGVAGGAVLGDGEIVFVLDIADLL